MLWLEMSRDEAHGGKGWEFGRCLWSVARKKDRSRWAYWETVLRVSQGDSVLHLRGIGKSAAFVGFSTASANGAETKDRPEILGDWEYASTFYRVPLENYVAIADPPTLHNVFASRDAELRSYFATNRSSPNKERLFYVVQAGRLQCLNGAYLSEVSVELAALLLGAPLYSIKTPQHVVAEASTSEQLRELLARVGQSAFSDAVRKNYSSRCCFPDCPVSERTFLRAAHIARWADAPASRGQTANGLCFCLMHDAAFEKGLFTIDATNHVWVNTSKEPKSAWATKNLAPYHGHSITVGPIPPSTEALKQHWIRTGCQPS